MWQFVERLQFDRQHLFTFSRSWFLKTKKLFLKCGYDIIHVCKNKRKQPIKDIIILMHLYVSWYHDVTATTRRRGHPLLSHHRGATCRPQQDDVLMKESSTGLCHLLAPAVRFILFQNLFLVKSKKKRKTERKKRKKTSRTTQWCFDVVLRPACGAEWPEPVVNLSHLLDTVMSANALPLSGRGGHLTVRSQFDECSSLILGCCNLI